MAARARNAARRGGTIAAVGVFAVIASVAVLVLLPREADRRVRAQLDAIPSAIDTTPLRQQLEHARSIEELALAALAAATPDSAVSAGAAVRERAPEINSAASADLSTRTIDSDRSDLVRQLAHARDAPLVESYRALGETHLLRSDARVRATLDSLEQVNREREAFAALGGPDARFAALSARLELLGRRLIRLAEQRLDALPSLPSPPDAQGGVPTHAVTRTTDSSSGRIGRVAPAAARDSVIAAELALASARRRNADVEQRMETATSKLTVHVPPLAMLTASMALGLALGYAVAFLLELQSPRVADVSEVERITQARVIVHGHRDRGARPQRARADGLPPVLDDASEAYQLLHLTLTGLGDGTRSVRVASAAPLLAATVGINLAAAAARESRATLLIDADPRAKLAADMLRTTHRTGSSELGAAPTVVEERVVRVPTGPQRAMDFLPAGSWPVVVDSTTRQAVTEQLKRLAARYDLTVLLTSGDTGSDAMLPSTDVILCVKLGITPLAWLTRASSHLLANQARVRAVIVWDAPGPINA